MKKFFGIMIGILLILGGGFFYLIKNPTFSLAQNILPILGRPIKTVNNIDLTNCVHYFDGCNNCTVKNGKLDVCTNKYCEHPSQPKCNQYISGTQPQGEQNTPIGIANPASVYCEDHGGKIKILTDANGGQFGMCYFPDGTSCEERAYMRGECGTNINSGFEKEITSDDQSENTVCTMEYAPVCARVAIQCIKAPCDPVEQTFGNKCMMNANKLATYLYDGECITNK